MLSAIADVKVSSGLRELSAKYGMNVGEAAIERCLQHLRILLKWNRVMNLVGDLSVESAVFRHYGESLFLACFMEQEFRRIGDFGSGAGFPGVGVAALYPTVQVELMEARQKRCAFLRESTRSFGNVHVWNGVAEEYPGKIDAVVARAVNIKQVVKFSEHYMVPFCLLVGEPDALEWHDYLKAKNFASSITPVPWRPQSVVFSSFAIDGVAGEDVSRGTEDGVC